LPISRMEAVRRDVERARMDAEHQVEMRLGVPPVPSAPPVVALPPLAPAAPAEPDLAAVPEPAPPAQAPAPWQMWFSIEEPTDGRTGEAVIRDVKTSVTAPLERQGPGLPHLPPGESFGVPVGFVPP